MAARTRDVSYYNCTSASFVGCSKEGYLESVVQRAVCASLGLQAVVIDKI